MFVFVAASLQSIWFTGEKLIKLKIENGKFKIIRLVGFIIYAQLVKANQINGIKNAKNCKISSN